MSPYVCAPREGLSWEASLPRNSTEESTPWLVHVAATNYRVHVREHVCERICVYVWRGGGLK